MFLYVFMNIFYDNFFFLILGYLKFGIFWCNRKRNVERIMQFFLKLNFRSFGRFGGISVRFYVKIVIIIKFNQIIDYKIDYLYFVQAIIDVVSC